MKKLIYFLLIVVFLFSFSYSQDLGSAAPDFTATDTNGNSVSISGLRGKVVLLKFWASWCGPCVRSLPSTWEKHKKYSSRGFTVIMFGLGGREQDTALLNQNSYNFPIQIDGKTNGRPSGYNFRGIPFELLIGKDGRILWKGHWGLTDQMIENALTGNTAGNSGNSSQQPDDGQLK